MLKTDAAPPRPPQTPLPQPARDGLRAEGLRLTLGGRAILRGIDLVARPGAVTAIVGPNGSGKTTLLRALTGEIAGEAGRITLNGRDIAGMKPWELACWRGVLPQASAIAFPFTVIEVVGLGLTARAEPGPPDLALRALERVDLAGFAGRFYHDLSGGEQQRVQLARVLAQIWEPVLDGQPRWLILDEPVSSLDIGHQFTVLEIARAHAAAGGGVLAVMHDLNLTALFADQVVMLEAGRIAAAGRPAEVMTDAALSRVYGHPLRVNRLPEPGLPFLLPQANARPG